MSPVINEFMSEREFRDSRECWERWDQRGSAYQDRRYTRGKNNTVVPYLSGYNVRSLILERFGLCIIRAIEARLEFLDRPELLESEFWDRRSGHVRESDDMNRFVASLMTGCIFTDSFQGAAGRPGTSGAPGPLGEGTPGPMVRKKNF